MKKITLFISFILLTSCYSYKLIDPTKEVVEQNNSAKNQNVNQSRSKNSTMQRSRSADDNNVTKPEVTEKKVLVESGQTGVAGDIKLYLKPNGLYKIQAQQKQHHIVVNSWVGDTLVASPKGKEDQILKFHKNDIDINKMYDRRFNKRQSDILTIGAYAAALTGVILLLK